MGKKAKKEIIYTREMELQNLKKNKSYKKLLISLIIILVVAAITISLIYGLNAAKNSLEGE